MVLRFTRGLLLVAPASVAAAASMSIKSRAPCLSLGIVENALLTTAKSDFGGHPKAFEAAVVWSGDKLRASPHSHQDHQDHPPRAPHLCCADYENGREAYSLLQDLLSPEAVRPVVHSEEHGACYLGTASHADAASILENHGQFRLESFAPFPSALKIAPDLLEHGQSNGPGRLGARHGALMRKDNVEGLGVELAPGTLPAHSTEAGSLIRNLLGDLMSESIDLYATNFWSDPTMTGGEHLVTPEGDVRGRDWSKAAAVVHGLSEAASASPGDICSWDSIRVHHAGDDLLLLSGLDHLLHSGRGAGGTIEDGEAGELHVACFMGLVSFLAGRVEVLRVASRHRRGLFNSAARANIQSATSTDTPFTDAGLDGSGQVIQVVDTGLDETSCFFVHDEEGDQVPHGHYFDELGVNFLGVSSSGGDRDDDDYTYSGDNHQSEGFFTDEDFSAFPDRRKVVQYINLVKSDAIAEQNDGFFNTSRGRQVPWLPADQFESDDRAGHGTHTAGSAAGATLNNPAKLAACGNRTVSCVGGCIDDSTSVATDDLVSYVHQYADLDRICPKFGCDGADCLGNDVSETLTKNGGMAQGAKLAIFDVFYEGHGFTDIVGNSLWEPCTGAGCKLHSNSWGGDVQCATDPIDVMFDGYMYESPEHLLIFAAGNSGHLRTSCTIASPATAKNVLAVGATSSGNTRFNIEDFGEDSTGVNEAEIDARAYFSSSGPTLDGRIKPEVMAPGDMIYSAASDGEAESQSCRLWASAGTSMSCAIVAGASAMVRQYFMESEFYAADMTARGFCDEWSGCKVFSPSSATLKALLINSANLMGGSSEPNGKRGFGRIHLEAGMPLAGNGSLALFVADASNTSTPELTRAEYNFDVDAGAGLDFRATLSWIDPPATTLSAKQLVHDLDLAVISPSGMKYTMWSSGRTDMVNVNERVIVDAGDVESGVWTVWVWTKELTTAEQSYSLVVNGAISPSTDVGTIQRVGVTTYSYGALDTSSRANPGIGTASSGSLVVAPAVSSAFVSLALGVVAYISAAAFSVI